MYDKEKKVFRCDVNMNTPLTAIFLKEILRELKEKGLLMPNNEYLNNFSDAIVISVERSFKIMDETNIEDADKMISREIL